MPPRCSSRTATCSRPRHGSTTAGWPTACATRCETFDRACDRWRELYRAALAQAKAQDEIIRDATKPTGEKRQAERLRREAENQLHLLVDFDNAVQSDFYSYRYFASEGFLPGYSFPRLPLAAFIPGRRLASGRDEFVQRPRFLAITEFGPRAIVYHEGAKYRVTKVNLSPTQQDEELAARQAKLCETCGYLHPIRVRAGPGPLRELRRAAAAARSPASCACRTSARAAWSASTATRRNASAWGTTSSPRCASRRSDRRPTVRTGDVVDERGVQLAHLTVAHAATLWRINLGWRHRENKNRYGFALDLQNGTWATDKALQEDNGDDPGDSVDGFKRHKLVVPFVEDTRNALLWKPTVPMDEGQFLSLRDALKNAIQVEYQLEDSELGAEVLPTQAEHDPTTILLYEAAEGGAGVLRQLLEDDGAVRRVARRALEICHFDPDTGEDLGTRRTPRSAARPPATTAS